MREREQLPEDFSALLNMYESARDDSNIGERDEEEFYRFKLENEQFLCDWAAGVFEMLR